MEIIKLKSFKIAMNAAGSPSSNKLAILLPGRLDTKDYECFNKHLELLSKKGFYAISVDPPGTWDSPGGIGLFTTTNYIKAVNELIEYFGNKSTLLLGHSRGGAVAMIAGTHNPKVKTIITINESFGTPSLPTEEKIAQGYYFDTRDYPPGTSKTNKRKEFSLPLSYFEDGTKYNDSEVFISCSKPKLIFFSEADEFNSFEEVRKLYNEAPDPKILIKLAGNHDYRYFPEAIKKVNKYLEEFIDEFFK